MCIKMNCLIEKQTKKLATELNLCFVCLLETTRTESLQLFKRSTKKVSSFASLHLASSSSCFETSLFFSIEIPDENGEIISFTQEDEYFAEHLADQVLLLKAPPNLLKIKFIHALSRHRILYNFMLIACVVWFAFCSTLRLERHLETHNFMLWSKQVREKYTPC